MVKHIHMGFRYEYKHVNLENLEALNELGEMGFKLIQTYFDSDMHNIGIMQRTYEVVA